jgi:uncharacterized protein YerC
MSQISKYPVSKQISDRIFEIFLKSLIEIKNENDGNEFISDLLSPTEKIVLSKRLAIAFLLEKGFDYKTIQSILKVSAPTIASVNTARIYGSAGYKKLISRILKEEMLMSLFDNAITKLLSAPAALEKGKGAWTYLKDQAKAKKNKNKKAF